MVRLESISKSQKKKKNDGDSDNTASESDDSDDTGDSAEASRSKKNAEGNVSPENLFLGQLTGNHFNTTDRKTNK